jgi:nicotinamide/nicotinate riboside kinase
MKSALIAIGGISRSGKSTLAYQLASALSILGLKASVVSQDDFCLPSSKLPIINEIPDWEQPETMDWLKYHEHIRQLETSNDWIILEGLFVFDDQLFSGQYDHEIILDIDYDTFMQRRNKEQRWGKEPSWYVQYVWDVYQKRNPKSKNATHISGTETINKDEMVTKFLQACS